MRRNSTSISTILRLLAVILTLLVSGHLYAQGGSPVPGKPTWTTPLHLSTDTGEARFEWAPKDGDAVELYRVSETAFGR